MRKSLIFIFSFITLLTFISASCLFDEWSDVQTLNQNCPDTGLIIAAQLKDAVGVIKENKTDSSFLFISVDMNKDGYIGRWNVIPCNVDLNQLKVNTKVKVSGIAYDSIKLHRFQDGDGFKFLLIKVTEVQVKN